MNLRSRAHDLLKSVDSTLGRRLVRRRHGSRALPNPPRDVLLVRLWGLGNLALLAPHVVASGGQRLRLLTLERNAPFVVAHLPGVVPLPVPDPLSPRFLPRCLAITRLLAADPPDVVVDLEQFLRLPLILVRSACEAPTVGLDTPGQGRTALLDHPVAHDPLRHVADTFASIWGAAGLPRGQGPGPLRVSDAASRRLARRVAGGRGPLVLVHPGSGDHFPGRRWPPERFGALAAALVEHVGARVVLTGGRAEARLSRRVLAASTGLAQDLTGRLAIDELVALIDLADLVVTNDTGPLHIADALGTRAVALYGPNTPHRYGPRQPGSVALFADLPCSPCLDDRTMKRSACRHYACMEALTVPAVLAACRAALGSSRAAPAPASELHHAVRP